MLSTTTSRTIYYLNRFMNTIYFKIEVEEGELKFRINKIQVFLSSIICTVIFGYMSKTDYECMKRQNSSFLQTSLRFSNDIAIYILYFNCFIYRNEFKCVFRTVHRLNSVLKTSLKNSKLFSFYLLQKFLVMIFFIVQDSLTYCYWGVSANCYFIGYIQFIPNNIVEITYVFNLMKINNLLNAMRKNPELKENFKYLREIHECRSTINSCYQIPMILKLALRFSSSLVIFEAIIKSLMSIRLLHAKISFSVIAWEVELVTEVLFILYFVQNSNDNVHTVRLILRECLVEFCVLVEQCVNGP